jgi:dynein heavy chain
MRALRDFNIPKIVTDDVPIIMGLIGDLFPALNVPRKRDMDFEKQIKQAVLDQKLQPEENFILKVWCLYLYLHFCLQKEYQLCVTQLL